jgi:hypothetical protein
MAKIKHTMLTNESNSFFTRSLPFRQRSEALQFEAFISRFLRAARSLRDTTMTASMTLSRAVCVKFERAMFVHYKVQ